MKIPSRLLVCVLLTASSALLLHRGTSSPKCDATSCASGCCDSYTENGELKTGGNGLTGHNETSENLNVNWLVAFPSLGAKTPGSLP